MFVLFLSGSFIGPAFDKWGARKLMLSGTFLCLAAFIACSFATEFYQLLLAQGLLFGLGCALLYAVERSTLEEKTNKLDSIPLPVPSPNGSTRNAGLLSASSSLGHPLVEFFGP